MLSIRNLVFFFFVTLAHCNFTAWSPSHNLTKRQASSYAFKINLKYLGKFYAATVNIGDSNFNLAVDTGSSNTWVSSLQCTCCYTGQQNCYQKSPTYQEPDDATPFPMPYTGGTVVTLTPAIDNFVLGTTTEIRSQYFFLSSGGIGGGTDGILGLGRPELLFTGNNRNASPPPTVLTNLKNRGTLSRHVFSVYLSEGDTSQLIFGGSDPSLYTGEMLRVPVAMPSFNSLARYFVRMESIYVGQVNICSYMGCYVVLDTGYTFIAMPQEIINIVEQTTQLRWTRNGISRSTDVSCENPSFPTIQFNLPNSQGSPLTLESQDLKVRNGYSCQISLSVVPHDANNDSYIVLGDPFFRKYYTEFDLDNLQIGIALSVKN